MDRLQLCPEVRQTRPRTCRTGLTLVEMLVATTVTVILVGALVQMFRVIGDNISMGRAIVELSTELRDVSKRLQRDLDGLTVPARPLPETSSSVGYLEIFEGPGRDIDPTPVAVAAGAPPILTQSMFGDYDDVLMLTSSTASEPFFGEHVALVNVNDRFQRVIRTVESKKAEIAWWTRVIDPPPFGNLNYVVDNNDRLALHRRELLVRPDLNFYQPELDEHIIAWFGNLPAEGGSSNTLEIGRELLDFLSHCDISVRIREKVAVTGPNRVVYAVANSLEDLTQRENRFAHFPVLLFNPTVTPPASPFIWASASGNLQDYPFELAREPSLLSHGTNHASQLRSLTTLDRLVQGFELVAVTMATGSVWQWQQTGTQTGEDTILANLLAFDLRVFDPGAPLVATGKGADGQWGIAGNDDDGNGILDDVTEANAGGSDDNATTLVPGDARYVNVVLGLGPFTTTLPTDFVGRGAYVDLNYMQEGSALNPARRSFTNPTRQSFFSGVPAFRDLPPATGGTPNGIFDGTPEFFLGGIAQAFYDTGSFRYEQNNFNEDLVINGVDDDGDTQVDETDEGAVLGLVTTPAMLSIFDQGSNGLDDDGLHGIDDVGERETSSPYPFPLRGAQITVRAVEPSTRQVRQMTVIANLKPE